MVQDAPLVFEVGEKSGVKDLTEEKLTDGQKNGNVGEEERRHVQEEDNDKNKGDLSESPGPFHVGSPKRKTTRGYKRGITSRPKALSPLMRKKQLGRNHQIAFGSLTKTGPLDFSYVKVVDKGNVSENISQPLLTCALKLNCESSNATLQDDEMENILLLPLTKPPDLIESQ